MTPFEKALEEAEITISAEKQPHTTDPKSQLEFRWTVDVLVRGRKILTTPYSAGIGHAVGVDGERIDLKTSRLYGWNVAHRLIATGNPQTFDQDTGRPRRVFWPTLTVAQVMESLLLDASVLDCSGFGEWASEYGFSEDSRQAYAIYQLCLSQALALRGALGPDAMARLSSLAQEQ